MQTVAGRLAWLGHLLDVQKVAGPNPARATLLLKVYCFLDLIIPRHLSAY